MVPTLFLLPYALNCPLARNPRIIEDLLAVQDPAALSAMIDMLEDLHLHGKESRFARKLEGLPLWELKTNSRDGAKGGARVYFTITPHGEALVINAEVKTGETPSEAKITEALTITLAHRNGQVRLQGGNA